VRRKGEDLVPHQKKISTIELQTLDLRERGGKKKKGGSSSRIDGASRARKKGTMSRPGEKKCCALSEKGEKAPLRFKAQRDLKKKKDASPEPHGREEKKKGKGGRGVKVKEKKGVASTLSGNAGKRKKGNRDLHRKKGKEFFPKKKKKKVQKGMLEKAAVPAKEKERKKR